MSQLRKLIFGLVLLTLSASAATGQGMTGMLDYGPVKMSEAQQRRLIAQDPRWKEALRIHYRSIVMDGHIDVPSLMVGHPDYSFGRRNVRSVAHVDVPRMIEGGLDAAFFSIYVAAAYPEGREARNRAREMIAKVKSEIAANSAHVALALSADDVRRITRSNRKAILMGIEGGHALAGSVEELRQFAAMGIRYVSPTHVNGNSWADASQSPAQWGGLNEKGRTIIREMNRLGVLVDISHASDETASDILDISSAPVIASHSSARSITENPRNLTDALIRRVAAGGGVVMVNFYADMINPGFTKPFMDEVYRRLRTEHNNNYYQLWQVINQVTRLRAVPPATYRHVVDHIDKIVQIAGIDHVGLGSDFDGATMPVGLEDATRMPWITYELLRRGYTETQINKILGGNTLRVLAEAERVSKTLR